MAKDYDRLLVAQDSGAVDDVEKAALDLERAIKLQAKTICEKYVHPTLSRAAQAGWMGADEVGVGVVRRAASGDGAFVTGLDTDRYYADVGDDD